MEKRELQDFKMLIRRGLLFAAPLAVILAVPFFVLSKSGELSSLSEIIARQQLGPTLAGFAYSYPAPYYKLHSVLARKPKIMAIGTSRVMQLREEFFTGVSFFNAGGGINTAENLLPFLDHIPQAQQPRLILLGLDQNFFNAEWDKKTVGNRDRKYSLDVYDGAGNLFLSSWKSVYADIFKGKIPWNALAKDDSPPFLIGLSARVHGSGFRSDGSYRDAVYTGESVPDLASRISSDLSQARQKTGTFVAGTDIDPKALGEVEGFLQSSKARGIEVIGFLPPFASAVYTEVYHDAELSCHQKIAPELAPLFKKYGFNFFDFSDPTAKDFPDNEMLDGVHGSEKTALRMLLLMAEENRELSGYTDSAHLRSSLLDSANPFAVFGE